MRTLNMPHEIQFDSAGHFFIAERDNHVIRKVDARLGLISTFAGAGRPGFGGDGGPACESRNCASRTASPWTRAASC